jgi:hypothetical protein
MSSWRCRLRPRFLPNRSSCVYIYQPIVPNKCSIVNPVDFHLYTKEKHEKG